MKKHAMMNYPNMHHYVCAVQIQTYTNTVNSRNDTVDESILNGFPLTKDDSLMMHRLPDPE